MQEKTATRGRSVPGRGSRQAEIKRLRDGLARLAADDLEFRFDPEGVQPYGDLARDLNRMAERLQMRRDEVVRAVELYCLRRFGTVLVHDLKNLAARLEFAQQNLRDADEPEVIEACAATVQDTAERIQSLVRRFQDQREAAVLKIRGNVNTAVRTALDHSGLRDAAGIELREELGQLPETLVDLSYLQEAFVNLFRNAAEAMSGKGRLEVVSRVVRRDGMSEVEVTVADDGPGMTEDFVHQELFAPFRSTKRKGMGLGMFSCKETVELHGGRVQVESSPGSGTTFRVTIPVVSAEEESS